MTGPRRTKTVENVPEGPSGGPRGTRKCARTCLATGQRQGRWLQGLYHPAEEFRHEVGGDAGLLDDVVAVMDPHGYCFPFNISIISLGVTTNGFWG